MWVPHPAWAHTLTALPTTPQPAPRPCGRQRAAPQLGLDALNIPGYNGLTTWEIWTAQKGGGNLWKMVERYTHTAGQEVHAGPPGRSIPSTVAMVVLNNGHYSQVRITPQPLLRRRELKAVDFMLHRDMVLPESPGTLLPDQPPDPLTNIVSGRAGSWQPGARPLLPLAVGPAMMAAHQGGVANMEVPR